MDKFDLQLLNLLQQDSRQTAEALGTKIGLSPAACQKRLKRLRQDGIVAREVAILSPRLVDRLTLIAEVTIERESNELLDQFRKTMLSAPEVMQCYYVTGDTDFFILLSVASMQDYERFTRTYFIEDKNIKRYKTHVVMSEVKVTLAKPLGE